MLYSWCYISLSLFQNIYIFLYKSSLWSIMIKQEKIAVHMLWQTPLVYLNSRCKNRWWFLFWLNLIGACHQQKWIAELQWDFHVDLRKGWPKLDHETIYLGSLFNSPHSDVKISVAKGGNENFFLSHRNVYNFCTLRPYYPC